MRGRPSGWSRIRHGREADHVPVLPFTPDTREQMLLAAVIDRLDALLAAMTPAEPPAQPAPQPARRRASKRPPEEA